MKGDIELEAENNLVSPGLVDSHVHLDMAFSATSERQPRNNSGPMSRTETIEKTATYFANTDLDRIEVNVRNAIKQAIINGVLHIRTHAYVDSVVEESVLETVASVCNKHSEYVDAEIVAFPQRGITRDDGSVDAVHSAFDSGADVVGGLDPATVNDDREGTIEKWFDIAQKHNADLDVHIHERDKTGIETLKSLAKKMVDRGYENRVTASHAYSLGDTYQSNVQSNQFDRFVESLQTAALKFITCYQSTPQAMPIKAFHDAGLVMAHGTDQVHDLWGAHGNLNALEAMLIESIQLDGYSTNKGLSHLWRLITTEGASILNCENTYSIEIGTPADLVVHTAKSEQWVILQQSKPKYVVKNGQVVASGGGITDKFAEAQ